ncbi:MAG: hypothetical protein HC876_04865 [Chloroflexaceae bacterium]|nr:hypothetical protein [Chloroflexaceae bacterium]
MLPGIGDDEIILLWTGGLWDWLDPLTLIHAMPQVLATCPQTRLVFLAGRHPGTVQEMQMPQRARALAAELGLLNQAVFFYEMWVPYQQRADFLLEADIAVSLHRDHLETAYAAIRSRFLDHLWAGLPSIVTAGDAAADLVRNRNLGYTVCPEDINDVVRATVHLVSNREVRQQCAEHARQIADAFTWERTLEPLSRFCMRPLRRSRPVSPHVVPEPPAALATVPPTTTQESSMQEEYTQLIQKLETGWQFGMPAQQGGMLSRVAQRVLGRVLAPVYAQQRDFNAALVQLFYQSAARHEEILGYLNAMMAQIVKLEQRIDTLARFDGVLSERIETINRDINGRLDALAAFDGTLSERIETINHDINGRLDTMADHTGDLHDRLLRLTYTVQLLNEALAAADEVSASLAEHLASLTPTAPEEGRPRQ